MSLKRIPALDGFRAIAVIIVMLSHVGLGSVIPGGFGVTIFFFLSGYLIISIMRLENSVTGKMSLKQFYFRRTIRIFPPLYITMGIVWLLSATNLLAPRVDAYGIVRDSLFLTNYQNLWSSGTGEPIPLWSIDVEEHFYILFSISFVLFLSRLPPKKAALICAIACLAILGTRLWIAFTSDNLDLIYYWSHTRLDSILFGGCLALWQNPALDGPNAWCPRLWHIGLAFAVLLGCLIVRNPIFRETFRYSLQGLGLFVLFSAALSSKGIVGRLMGSWPLRWVSLLSYTLYLIHVPVLNLIQQNAHQIPALVTGALMFVFSAAYAVLMYLLVEHPLLRWRTHRKAVLRAAHPVSSHQGFETPVISEKQTTN